MGIAHRERASAPLPRAAFEPPTPDLRPARIDSLTGVRFFAAIAVVFYHYWEDFFPGTHTPRPFDSGFMGVSFFFVLSGYILGFVYLPDRTPTINTKRFMVARFARVYPSYALSLLFQFPIIGWIILQSQNPAKRLLIAVGTLLPHLILLQGWWTYLDWNWNPPSWSLCAEAFFYLLFPVLAIWSDRQTGFRRLIALMSASYVMMLAGPAVLLAHGIGWSSQPRPELLLLVIYAPPFRIPEFMIGLLLSVLQKRLNSTYVAHKVRRLGTTAMYHGLGVIAVVLLLGSRIPFVLRYNGVADLAFAAIIFGLAVSHGRLRQFLSLPILTLLGEASYSIYIFQAPLFFYFQLLLRHLAASNLLGRTSAFVAYVGVLVGLSIACFKYAETPIRRTIRGWHGVVPLADTNG